jgi:hypothetical protein
VPFPAWRLTDSAFHQPASVVIEKCGVIANRLVCTVENDHTKLGWDIASHATRGIIWITLECWHATLLISVRIMEGMFQTTCCRLTAFLLGRHQITFSARSLGILFPLELRDIIPIRFPRGSQIYYDDSKAEQHIKHDQSHHLMTRIVEVYEVTGEDLIVIE